MIIIKKIKKIVIKVGFCFALMSVKLDTPCTPQLLPRSTHGCNYGALEL